MEIWIEKYRPEKVSDVADRMKSGAVSITKNNGVEIIEYNSETPWILKKKKPDLIVLAGFLKIEALTL